MISEQAVFRDPRELCFGLNDFAERLRSLRPEELDTCWAEVQKHIEEFIETLGSFDRPVKTQQSLTGGTYQSVVLALQALRMAHRSAAEHSLRSTSEAVRQASSIMRGCSLAMPIGEQVNKS
jgi:hypothetical protein